MPWMPWARYSPPWTATWASTDPDNNNDSGQGDPGGSFTAEAYAVFDGSWSTSVCFAKQIDVPAPFGSIRLVARFTGPGMCNTTAWALGGIAWASVGISMGIDSLAADSPSGVLCSSMQTVDPIADMPDVRSADIPSTVVGAVELRQPRSESVLAWVTLTADAYLSYGADADAWMQGQLSALDVWAPVMLVAPEGIRRQPRLRRAPGT